MGRIGRGWILGLCLAALAAPATGRAQTTLTLRADPVPIVDARINNHPVRLEVDLRLSPGLVLSTAEAARLGLQLIPFVKVVVSDNGQTRLRGRLARPQIVFNGQSSRAMAGIFGVPVSDRADGVIGPGVLPYDVVTVRFGADPGSGGRDIVLPMPNSDVWASSAIVGDQHLTVQFNLARTESVFNRVAAQRFDAAGLIVGDGPPIETPVILGLTSLMQPVHTSLTALGFPLSPGLARTDAPLHGADGPDVVVVEAHSPRRPPPESITLGRAALAQCSSISANRLTHQIILHCD